VNEQVARTRETINGYKSRRDELSYAYKAIRREFFNLLDAQRAIKSKVRMRNYDELIETIESISVRLETKVMTLNEEQRLVQELKYLELSKPYLIETNERQELIDENKAR
jgi:uncharacterized coiled-coil DUF342 family protein